MRRVLRWMGLALVPLACVGVGILVGTLQRGSKWDYVAPLLLNLLFCVVAVVVMVQMDVLLKPFQKLVDRLKSSADCYAGIEARLRELDQVQNVALQDQGADIKRLLDVVREVSGELNAIRKQVNEIRDQILRARRAGASGTAGASERTSAERISDLHQAIELWKQNGGPTDTRLWRHAQALVDLERRFSLHERPDDALLNDVARYLYGVSPEHEPEMSHRGLDLELVARLGGAVAASRCRLLRAFEDRFKLRPIPIVEGETPYSSRLHERSQGPGIPTNNPEKHERIARVHRHGFVSTNSGDVHRRALVAVYQLEGEAPVSAIEPMSKPDQWGDGVWDRVAKHLTEALASEPSSAQRRNLIANASQLGLVDWNELQIGNLGGEWVSGGELETLPTSFADGLQAVGVRWRGQLKVRPRAAEQP